MKRINNFLGLFEEQLKEQSDGELQQLEALGQLRAKTCSKPLRKVIDRHIDKIKKQQHRLAEIFSLLRKPMDGEHNLGVKGLIAEAHELVERCTENDLRDSGIIISVQHLNRYNIASYCNMATYAEELNQFEIADQLKESLAEEQRTDKLLSELTSHDPELRAAQSVHEFLANLLK